MLPTSCRSVISPLASTLVNVMSSAWLNARSYIAFRRRYAAWNASYSEATMLELWTVNGVTPSSRNPWIVYDRLSVPSPKWSNTSSKFWNTCS